ncbi:uncharacterized protein [Mytilus edulis]|uniref:uncharacterized protein n=1 Tax=Mytilus edulis TaxID=6550 RepID=UPI0039EF9707
MGARTSKPKKQNSDTNQSSVTAHHTDTSSTKTFDIRSTVGPSGLYYYYPIGPTKEVRTPPKLSRHHQNVKSSMENLREMAEELEEKMMIANILREENLRSKGKAARDFEERYARVMERKALLTEGKIQKVQDKMVLDEVRLLNRPKMNKPRLMSHSIPHLSKTGTNSETQL